MGRVAPRRVGRDAEWALLQAAWERGDAVAVVGEAGMGKTRLVDAPAFRGSFLHRNPFNASVLAKVREG